jgi:hypothetical protein
MFSITTSIRFERRMALREFTNSFDNENSEKHTNLFVNHCGLDIWGSELHSILGDFVTTRENE